MAREPDSKQHGASQDQRVGRRPSVVRRAWTVIGQWHRLGRPATLGTLLSILGIALFLTPLTTATLAADKTTRLATPKGGRLLEKTEPLAEFVVEKDRTVRIHFYNRQLQPVAATTQTATVIADTKSGKTTLPLQKQGDALASTAKLPAGDGYTVVVQFRMSPDAKPLNLRFKLDLHTCPDCNRPEYGCTCDH